MSEGRAQLYGRRWREARVAFLAEHPLCAICEQQGRTTVSQEVHHNPAHNGDPERFWDVATWVPLCAEHHRTAGREQDLKGHHSLIGLSGEPIDEKHPWYRDSSPRGG